MYVEDLIKHRNSKLLLMRKVWSICFFGEEFSIKNLTISGPPCELKSEYKTYFLLSILSQWADILIL